MPSLNIIATFLRNGRFNEDDTFSALKSLLNIKVSQTYSFSLITGYYTRIGGIAMWWTTLQGNPKTFWGVKALSFFFFFFFG